MVFKYNNTDVEAVTYNGNDVDEVKFNGTTVYLKEKASIFVKGLQSTDTITCKDPNGLPKSGAWVTKTIEGESVSGWEFANLTELGDYELESGSKTEEVAVLDFQEYVVTWTTKLYLYNEGDECEDVTGGWIYTYDSRNTSNMCKSTGTQIYVTGTGTTYVAGGGTAKIRNAVPLAGYTNIGIEIATCTGSIWDDTHSFVGYGDLSDVSYPLKPYYGKVQQNVSAATTFLYAISNFNTNTAIGVYGNASNYASISVYINKVWLE